MVREGYAQALKYYGIRLRGLYPTVLDHFINHVSQNVIYLT